MLDRNPSEVLALSLWLGVGCVGRVDGAEDGTESDGPAGSTASAEVSSGASSSLDTTADPLPEPTEAGTTEGSEPPPEGGLGPWGFGYVQHPEIEAQWVGLADFDGDGLIDVFIRNADGDGVSLRGDGSGQLELVDTVSLPSNADFMRAGDYDGDGDLDVAVFDSYAGDSIFVRSNDGDGGFSGQVTSSISGFFGFGAVPMRLDADADHDLFVPDGHSQGAFVAVAQGDGAFEYGPQVPVMGCYLSNTAVGEFDGDGLDDIVATGSCNAVPGVLPLAVYRHQAGAFDMVQMITGEQGPVLEGSDIVLVDTDADGELDIVTPTEHGLYLIHNEGAGTFADPPVVLPHEIQWARHVAPIHVDAEGHLGFVLEWFDYTDGFLAALVIPDPTWTSTTSESIDLQGRFAGSADIDGDGAPDLVVLVSSPTNPEGPGELGIWLSGG